MYIYINVFKELKIFDILNDEFIFITFYYQIKHVFYKIKKQIRIIYCD
jgi:hypothetical protein